MANIKPIDGHVLEAHGLTVRLRWDLGALATFEELSGESMGPGFKIGMRHLLHMLYAAMLAEARWQGKDPPMTVEQLGSLFNRQSKIDEAMAVLGSMLAEFFETDLNETEEPEEGKGEPVSNEGGSAASTRSARSISKSPKKSSGGSRSRNSARAGSGTKS